MASSKLDAVDLVSMWCYYEWAVRWTWSSRRKGSVRGRAGYNRERSSNNDEVVEEVATCLTQTTNTSE